MKGSRPTRDELARLLEGEVVATRAAELDAAGRDDAGLRAELEAERALHASLRASVPELEGVDLVEAVRAGLEPAPAPGPSRQGRAVAAAAVALAAMALAFVVWSGRPSTDDARVKGGPADAVERWTGVWAYTVAADGRSAPLSSVLRAGDGLAFSYLNASASPFSHLLVFGVGPSGAVFWYYPAWEQAEEDPEAVAIRAGPEVVSLGEKIVHPLEPGRFVVRAVFATRPIRVSEVEEMIRELGAVRAQDVEHVPLPGTVQQRVVVEVVP